MGRGGDDRQSGTNEHEQDREGNGTGQHGGATGTDQHAGPARADVHGEITDQRGEPGVAEPIRVLLVDDADDAAAAATRLERECERFSVAMADGGAPGLQRVRDESFDCVVSALPPSEGSPALLDSVRAERPEVPFVLFAGERASAGEALAAGVTEFVRRGPDQFAALANTVERVVDRTRFEERFETLFRHSMESIVEAEFRGGDPIVRRVNRRFEEVFGFDAGELVGESLDEYVVPADGREEAIRINVDVENARRVQREVTRSTADGRREFLLQAIPLDVGNGDRCFATYTDVTARKERERRLGALHAATREVMAGESRAAVASRAVDAADRVLGFECACVYWFDEESTALDPVATAPEERALFDPEAAVGPGDGAVWYVYRIGEPLAVDDVRDMASVDADATAARSQLLLPVGDHGVFAAASRVVDAFDEADEALANLLASHLEVALDRTEREQLLAEREAELLRQNERLEEFAGVVSHDLRNPLTVATGNAHLLRKRGDLKYLDALEDALGRVEALIDDLLTLAREGETVGETTWVDLAAVASDAWRSVSTGSATLTVREGSSLLADEPRLQQLFENLFRNAVEHGGDGVSVEVGAIDGRGDPRASDNGSERGFYVADDGRGIPPDERDAVFEGGFSTESDGTGLGLAIVEEIVEAHGWHVTATEGRDGGARFEVTGIGSLDVTESLDR